MGLIAPPLACPCPALGAQLLAASYSPDPRSINVVDVLYWCDLFLFSFSPPLGLVWYLEESREDWYPCQPGFNRGLENWCNPETIRHWKCIAVTVGEIWWTLGWVCVLRLTHWTPGLQLTTCFCKQSYAGIHRYPPRYLFVACGCFWHSWVGMTDHLAKMFTRPFTVSVSALLYT